MGKHLAGWALIIGAVVVTWAWPTSRHFFLGRLDNNIGFLYATGIGVTRDHAEAVRWYRRGASYGATPAEFNLAFALQNGDGVPPDEHEAAIWYERAANHGNAQAANNLGLMYANPTNEAPNLVLARIWLKRALPLADHDLAATIQENLASMEKDMTEAELAASNDPATNAVAAVAPVGTRKPAPPADEATPPEQKIRAALDSAVPLRGAVTRFVTAHHHLPTRSEVAAEPALAAVDTAQAHIAIGNGGAIEVALRGGTLNGNVVASYVPMLVGGRVTWICTKGRLPPKYLGSACT